MIAIVLLLLPWVTVLARRHHHLDGGTVGILAAVSLGLSTLWITWAAYRGPRQADGAASGPDLAQFADQLAIAVGAQWNAEAAIRRLNDPYPLPVSWIAADPSLTDPWDSLVKLATSGVGWPPPQSPETWATGPNGLAGKGGQLADVLARVPTGRLVVLGEPGAGKTILMVRLVLDMLARRSSGGPVPVLASLASWDPARQDLHSWLAAQLVIAQPALAAAAPPGSGVGNLIQALLAAGLILPILDGLDEIPDKVRGPAISKINDALRPGEHLLVTCRTQQYRDAVRPPGGVEVTLTGAAAVQLCPLDAGAVRDYLCDSAGGPVTRARWTPVLAVLGTEAPAGQALSTPLMAGLARAIYNPRPGELAGGLRDPAELCSPALADRAAAESLLFDAFIPAAYRHDPAGRWTAMQAETWLKFLARHLEQTIGMPDLAWWQLQETTPRTALVLRVGFGLAAGLAGWLAAGLAGVPGGLWFGLAGVYAALFAAGPRNAEAPARGMRISVSGLARGFAAGFAAGVAAGLMAGPAGGLTRKLADGLAFGIATGLVLGSAAGIAAVPGKLTGVTSPRAVLERDRQMALLLMLAGGPVGWLTFGVAAGLTGKLTLGLTFGIAIGLGPGLGAGLGLSMRRTAWPSSTLTRGWLALHRQLPWSLMSFLADAHSRGVLRQVGAVYQFRHIELQHRLASRDVSAVAARANSGRGRGGSQTLTSEPAP